VIPTFEERVEQWSSPPVDDVGYISSASLLKLREDDLMEVVETMESSRYGGWRNYENRWWQFLGLGSTRDRYVLDYGCGVGIEALQYCRGGNDVVVADISRDNVRLAMRILALQGFNVGSFQIVPDNLVNGLFGSWDIVHCCGVLHHIPNAAEVVEQLALKMSDEGELRLMVYSDEAWRLAVGTDPPEVVEEDPGFETYWKRWDAVGGYADWYDADRLDLRFGEWFEVRDTQYLTEKGEYLGAILVKR
jgi:SAM-dependent methyltransferase